MASETKVHSILDTKRTALSEAFIAVIRPYKLVAWVLWGTVIGLTLVNAVFVYYILSDLDLSEVQRTQTHIPKVSATILAAIAGGISLLIRNIFLSKKVFDRIEEEVEPHPDDRKFSTFEIKFLKMIPRWNIVNFSTWLLNAAICVIGMFVAMMDASFGLVMPFLIVSLVFNFVMRPDWNVLVEKWK